MNEVYRFGPFVLDPQRRTLSCDGSAVPLTPKVFDILLFLVQNPNRVITRQELMGAVWPETFVEEGNLTQSVSLLRKALAERCEDRRLIVTLARQGYQLTANVIVDGGQEAERPEEAPTWREVAPVGADGRRPGTRARGRAALLAAAVLAIGASYIAWQRFRPVADPGPERIRLAVLPFQNLTGDPGQDYLADGLTEELITELTRLSPERLGVIARTSVMGYKDDTARLDQIGRELAVQYALEGSLRRHADRLRITVRLVQVKDQSHLWAADFNQAPRDVLALEDEVAVATAREIELRLNPQQLARLNQVRRVDPAAFDAYLQGRYFLQRAGKENLDSATKYFERAVGRDPGYALAWVWLSEARRRAADRGFVPAEEGNRRAREAVERALSLDPDLADAHVQLGWIRMLVDWDWAGADASFKRALTLDPGNPDVANGASVIAAKLGRFDEAVELARRSVELDPLNPEPIGSLGQLFYDMGRLPEAAASLERSLELFNLPHAPEILGLVYLAQGRNDRALAMLDRETSAVWKLHGQALVYYALGRRSDADSALAQFIAQYQEFAAIQIAEIYAFRGETDRAFEWLDRAYARRDQGVSSVKRDRLLKGLHGDPRWAAFLAKVRLPV